MLSVPKRTLIEISPTLAVTDCPDIGRHRRELRVGQGHPAKRRHGAWMLLRLLHAFPDDVGYALQAAVTPEPGSRCEVGSHWRATAIGAVAAGACRTRDLAMEDLLAQRDLIGA